MKRLVILLLFAPCACFGQSNSEINFLLESAYDYFKAERYANALSLYEEAMELTAQNVEVNYQLAECYRYNFNYPEAEIYYEKVTYMDLAEFPLSLYYLGLMQKYNGKYAVSIKSFTRFLKYVETTDKYPFFKEQSWVEIAGSELALNEQMEDPLFGENLFGAPVNSAFNDFNPAHLNDSVLFITSARTTTRELDPRYGEGFTDVYYLVRTGDSWQDKTTEVLRKLNSKYHDGSGSFNRSRTAYYFTVCGQKQPECQLYYSAFEDNSWSAPEPLSELINKKGYDSKQPVISYTGDTLFFVSNMPGGYGENDIWMSIKAGSSDWGPAMNLGPAVNTRMDEVSPSVTPLPNVLMFASNGHQGYGGLDLFIARRLSDGDTSLINMGHPFNTSRDEFYPELFQEEFYWSSNREGGVGSFDIYSSNTGLPLKFLSKLNLRQSAKRSEVMLMSRRRNVSGGDIYAMFLEDKLQYDQLSDEEKSIVDRLVNGEDPENVFNDLNAENREDLLQLAKLKMISKDDSFLKKLNPQSDYTGSVVVSGSLYSNSPIDFSEVRISLKDSTDQIVMITGVSENGEFQFNNMVINQPLFLKQIITGTPEENLRVKNLEIKPMNNESGIMENIYFDLDRFTLRSEAMRYLESLVELLSQNENAQIEIWAFADNTGSDEYNDVLTRKRAMEVYNYLVENGVRGNQLMINPQGKEFSDNLQRTGVERQISRRVEFKSYKLQNSLTPFSTCFAQKNMPVKNLLRELKISREDYIKWNGPDSDEEIRLFQPLRFPDRPESSEVLHCPVTL